MAAVVLSELCKRYGESAVVDDLSLEVNDGEFMVLLGPSGCGKTTMLRMIAGLERATSGSIVLGGRVANDIHPSERDIAMVFQSYALYPHMTVRRNLGYGLLRRGMDRRKVAGMVTEMAASLGLEDLLDRKPSQLSGGQRQRVALGRAVIRQPQVFLMDEPLSNLDAKLRVEMRNELVRLQGRLGITTIYVTHDQVEAMTMGHRVAIMNKGKLEQVGTPLDLFRRPANTFVAEFMGHPRINMFRGSVRRGAKGTVFHGSGLECPLPCEVAEGLGEVWLGIRPQDLRVAEARDSVSQDDLAGTARLDFVEHLGTESFGVLSMMDRSVAASIDGNTLLAAGDAVRLRANPAGVLLFEVTSGRRIPLTRNADHDLAESVG